METRSDKVSFTERSILELQQNLQTLHAGKININ
jgi:hypothetical protein